MGTTDVPAHRDGLRAGDASERVRLKIALAGLVASVFTEALCPNAPVSSHD